MLLYTPLPSGRPISKSSKDHLRIIILLSKKFLSLQQVFYRFRCLSSLCAVLPLAAEGGGLVAVDGWIAVVD